MDERDDVGSHVLGGITQTAGRCCYIIICSKINWSKKTEKPLTRVIIRNKLI